MHVRTLSQRRGEKEINRQPDRKTDRQTDRHTEIILFISMNAIWDAIGALKYSIGYLY